MAKAETLGEKAADGLLRLIQEKSYRPGDRLPNEYELSEVLGVGRNTVREALRALASRNIVEIRQGAGTFMSEKKGVADDPLGFSMTQDRDRLAQELRQLRLLLEPQIAALAAQNAVPEDLEKLELALRQNDRDFHIQVAECTHNSVISTLISILTGEGNEDTENCKEIFDAIRRGRGVDAYQAMTKHLL